MLAASFEEATRRKWYAGSCGSTTSHEPGEAPLRRYRDLAVVRNIPWSSRGRNCPGGPGEFPLTAEGPSFPSALSPLRLSPCSCAPCLILHLPEPLLQGVDPFQQVLGCIAARFLGLHGGRCYGETQNEHHTCTCHSHCLDTSGSFHSDSLVFTYLDNYTPLSRGLSLPYVHGLELLPAQGFDEIPLVCHGFRGHRTGKGMPRHIV